MKIYTLRRVQCLPITIEEAWQFFSAPDNLLKITPEKMGLIPTYRSGNNQTYSGQIVFYRVRVLPGISVQWVTEMRHVQEPVRFVDEQRFGPYAWWHHQHTFKSVDGGVEMIDEVNYALPMGFLGRLVHALFVGRQVSAIFDYRSQALNQHFKLQPDPSS